MKAANIIKIWTMFFAAAIVQAPAIAAPYMPVQTWVKTFVRLPVVQADLSEGSHSLVVTIPQNIQLATPFNLKAVASGAALVALTVYQKDELGHHAADGQKIDVSKMLGNTVSGTVIPMLMGSVTFTIKGVFKDGDVETQEVTVPVSIPAIAPTVFRGDQLAGIQLPGGIEDRWSSVKVAYSEIGLELGSPVLAGHALQPLAYYSTIPDEVDEWGHAHPVEVQLDGRVQYSIVPSSGSPVVRLEQDPQEPSDVDVVAVGLGTAIIEARFGTAVDHIKVTVQKPQTIK